jgi:hypothetical protein
VKPAAFEADRLRKTIALADEAIREAAALRSAAHAPGETAEETAARWDDAGAVEAAAKDCRKAARKALGALTVFSDVRTPEETAAAIEAARSAALALRDVCSVAQWNTANREISKAARSLAEQAEQAERKAAEAERLRQDLDSGAESPGRIEAARRAWIAEEAAKAEAREIRKAAQAARKKGGAL